MRKATEGTENQERENPQQKKSPKKSHQPPGGRRWPGYSSLANAPRGRKEKKKQIPYMSYEDGVQT